MPLMMTRAKTSLRYKDNADDDDTTSLLTCSSSTDEEQQQQQQVAVCGGGGKRQRSSWTTPPSLRKLGRHLQRHSSHHHRHNNGQGDERSCSQNSGAGNGGGGSGSSHTRRSLLNFRRNHTEHGVCETRQSLLRKDTDSDDISESNNDEYPFAADDNKEGSAMMFRPLRARGQTWDGTMKETTPSTIKGTTPASTILDNNNDDDDEASLSSFGSFANERGSLVDEDVIESDIDEDDGSEYFADTALCRIKCQAVPLPARVLTLWITSPDCSARHLELDLHSCVDAREEDDDRTTTHEAARTVACCGL